MKAIGIDVGYGFTKAIADDQKVVFPSLVGPAETMDFDAGLGDGGMTLYLNNHSYFVGERAALQSRLPGRTLDRSRVTTEEAKVLFLSALVSLFPDGMNGLTVGTGLPIAWLKDRESLKAMWEGMHSVRIPGKPPIRFGVDSVSPVPQAFGTLVREMFADDFTVKDRELLEGSVGVVDFGTLTINFLSFERGEYVQRESSSLKIGMIRVLETLHRAILDKYDIDVDLSEVDQILRSGSLSLYGEEKPIGQLADPILQSLVADSIRHARSLWGDGWNKQRILLTGGGAYALGSLFKEAYGHPKTSIVHDSQMANAQGLLLWAKYLESRK